MINLENEIVEKKQKLLSVLIEATDSGVLRWSQTNSFPSVYSTKNMKNGVISVFEDGDVTRVTLRKDFKTERILFAKDDKDNLRLLINLIELQIATNMKRDKVKVLEDVIRMLEVKLLTKRLRQRINKGENSQ